MSHHLYTYTNKENGIASFVSKHVNGFSVSAKDLDADEYLPTIRIYPNLNDAIAGAIKIVKE